MSLLSQIIRQWSLWGELLLEEGSLPFFSTDSKRSDINNSSPYVITSDRLEALLGGSEKRQQLLRAYREAITQVETYDIRVRCTLVGGSFLNLIEENPGDIDCVLFYSAGPRSDIRPAELERRMKKSGVDARLIPSDGSPFLLIKSAIFFSNLYSNNDFNTSSRRASILIDYSGLGS